MEADTHTIRPLARGYTKTSLKKTFNRVTNIERRDLIFKKTKRGNNKNIEETNTTRIILRYSNEHGKIRKILTKYWPISTEDPIFGSLVTINAQITFKNAGSIGGKCVQSEYKGDSRGDPCKTRGTFPCGSCSQCLTNRKRTQFHLPKGDIFQVKHFANCKTQGVVYIMQCQCGAFYVGKTK